MIITPGNSFVHLCSAVLPALFLTFPAFSGNAVCPVLDEHKIAFMGSSVCQGWGASDAGGPFDYYESFGNNLRGYVYDYAALLNDRFTSGEGEAWYVTNISIGGNKTTDVMGRWEQDLLPTCAKYVVYGLSQANEGMLFDQFRDNMLRIIQQTRDSGMVPLVVNNYTNNGFDDAAYAQIKAMDMLIHGWDVPSINVLGAVDDGAGHWAPGFFMDGGHPNDAGHLKMSKTIVPSLFDALSSGKELPVKMPASLVTLAAGSRIFFQPEALLEAFTLSFEVRTASEGTLLEFSDGNDAGTLNIGPSGFLIYTSATSGGVLTGASTVNDNAWHTITLTQYPAIARSFLYVDALQQGSAVGEQVSPDIFSLGSASGPETADFRNLFFYRSGMNQTELDAIQSGTLLKSSLEIYAPLDGEGTVSETSLTNYAQSMNVLEYEGPVAVIRSTETKAGAGIRIELLADGNISYNLPLSGNVTLEAFDLSGKHLATLVSGIQDAGNHVVGNTLKPEWGVVLLKIRANGHSGIRKVSVL